MCQRRIIHMVEEEGTEFSDTGCVGVVYEDRKDDLFKQMALQLFALCSWQSWV